MGRITVFTANDIPSKVVKMTLDKNQLPYVEISVVDFPEKYDDLQSLCICTASVPQVFFNARHVGGMNCTMMEMQVWNLDKRYGSPAQRYKDQIAAVSDLADNRFNKLEDVGPNKKETTPTTNTLHQISITLPDETMTTVLDIMEKLKNSLSFEDIKVKGTIYKKAVKGEHVAATLSKTLKLSAANSQRFGSHLVKSKVLRSITDPDGDFEPEKGVYRLQCFMTPSVLNSYCIWEGKAGEAIEVVARLDKMLAKIEKACVGADGKLDFGEIVHHADFPAFEEATCELQNVDVTTYSENEKTAVALNTYHLFMRYAMIKYGIPETEATRLTFLSKVQFNFGFHVFTLKQWVDGILRGNRKATYGAGAPFQKNDPRQKLAVKELDARIHFALNVGYSVGVASALPFDCYSGDKLDKQLNIAGKICCADESILLLDRNNKQIGIQKSFLWYQGDFGKNESDFISFMEKYLEGNNKYDLEKIFMSNKKTKTIFFDADWTRYAKNYFKFNKDNLMGEIKGTSSLLRRFWQPKTPENEPIRLATLRSHNLLDTLEEERFDRITRMVQKTFDCTYVFISLVDANRQWFKSNQWMACDLEKATETGRDISFCGHAILNDDLFIIENALEDERFADNPLVTGPVGIRSYAGYPLSVPSIEGNGTRVNIGTLCAIDRKPRKFTLSDRDTLRKFGEQVTSEISRKGGAEASKALGTDSNTLDLETLKILQQKPTGERSQQ